MGRLHPHQLRVLQEQEEGVGRGRGGPLDERFSRQTRFAPLGPEGQARLRRGSVLVVGIGALGTHAAAALARAGVGELYLVDRDVVELHNLPRQALFTEADAAHGRPKAIAAAARLRRIASACRVHPLAEEFDADLFARLERRPDAIVDGTDNFATRYLINDLAHRHAIPWAYGGALGARGSAMAVLPGATPCLRCLVPQAAPADQIGTCETEGILAPAVAMVAAFQTAQVLKVLAGQRDAVARGVLEVDVWEDRFALRLRRASPSPDCPACGAGTYPALEVGPRVAARLCGREAVQVLPHPGAAVDLAHLASRLRGAADGVELTPQLLRFVADGCRFSVFPSGRALLFGVSEPRRAQVLYDRWVGAP